MDLREVEEARDPMSVFHRWMDEAAKSEPNDPNAAALATADEWGIPSVRMVLVKQADERGFCFYTSSESRKGRELATNPHAALCFHWKSLARQVRVEGAVLELPNADADAYFDSRSRGSQIGAAVSRQSTPLQSREELKRMVAEYAARTPGEVTRPTWWKGYVVRPERIEFWSAGEDRLHDRIVFTRSGSAWAKERLFP